MAAYEVPTKLRASLILENGTTESGTLKTASVALPTLELTATNDKIMAVVEMLEPVLSLTNNHVEKVITYTVGVQ